MKKTPLYEQHKVANAVMGKFASFEMPLYYTQVKEEVKTVRKAVGIFDVSHMGNILIIGSKAEVFLEKILVSSVKDLKSLKMKYTALCNEQGGVIDDVVVTLLEDNAFHLVVNASTLERVYSWLQEHLIAGVELKNKSDQLGMISLQGPLASKVIQKLVNRKVEHLNRFYSRSSLVGNQLMLYSRTGYTGEDGFEFYPNSKKTQTLWSEILEAGAEFGIKPIGLVARDSLRLEAGYSLYGSELSEDQNLLDSGLGWLVDFDKNDFIGKQALLEHKAQDQIKKIVGIKTLKKAIPRQNDTLFWNDEPCGSLTSGGFSFWLKQGIGLARISSKYTQYKTDFFLQSQGRKIPVEITSRYFYKKFMSSFVKKIFFNRCFFAVLIIVGGLFLYMIRDFVFPFFMAGLFTFLTYPIYLKILSWFKNPYLSSIITLVVVFIGIIIPLGSLLFWGYKQAALLFFSHQQFFTEPEIWEFVLGKVSQAFHWVGIELPVEDGSTLLWLKTYIQTKSQVIVQKVFSSGLLISKNFVQVLFQASIVLICSFYLFVDGKKLMDLFVKLLPLQNSLKQKLFTNLLETLQLSLKSVTVIGFVQGVLGAIVLFIAGFDSFIFWGIVMVVLSIIPAVGIFAVLLPTVIILWVQSSISMSIFVLFACCVIGSIDQVLRPLIMGKKSQLSDLLIVISTLAEYKYLEL